jgi:hypothetical protein
MGYTSSQVFYKTKTILKYKFNLKGIAESMLEKMWLY